jgi:hypothetical protein
VNYLNQISFKGEHSRNVIWELFSVWNGGCRSDKTLERGGLKERWKSPTLKEQAEEKDKNKWQSREGWRDEKTLCFLSSQPQEDLEVEGHLQSEAEQA